MPRAGSELCARRRASRFRSAERRSAPTSSIASIRRRLTIRVLASQPSLGWPRVVVPYGLHFCVIDGRRISLVCLGSGLWCRDNQLGGSPPVSLELKSLLF
jgi:hypothetical protein